MWSIRSPSTAPSRPIAAHTGAVIEHLRQLHPQPGQIVDVEEASVIDVIGGDAKVRQAPMLPLDQLIQRLPAREVPSRPRKRSTAAAIAAADSSESRAWAASASSSSPARRGSCPRVLGSQPKASDS